MAAQKHITMLHGPASRLALDPAPASPLLRPLNGCNAHIMRRRPRICSQTAVHSMGTTDMPATAQPSPQPEVSEQIAAAQADQLPGSTRLSNAALVRRLTAVATANGALDIFLQDSDAKQAPEELQGFTEEECRVLISACMARSNAPLALSIYGTMCRVAPGSSVASAERHLEQAAWPPATLETVSAVVMGLARALRLKDAYSAIADVRRRGIPSGEEVPFGQVVNSPMASGAPLTVVHPHEGCRVAACASSRYVYEVFSGEVARVESEALVQEQSLLLAAARSANLWRERPLASVHQMVIRAPDGQARTFRYGTESADVPAQVGERVSIVCSPTERSVQSAAQGIGRFRPFGSGPPFTRPGQPLALTNHATGREHALQPPPSSAVGIPGWVLPAAVLFSASDAASGLINPAMPLLIAGAVASAATAGVLGSTVLIPRLKQLPEQSLQLETVRQKLLSQLCSFLSRVRALVARTDELEGEAWEDARLLARLWPLANRVDQHNALVVRMDQLEGEAGEDVRLLARLWQLANKMESVGNEVSYGARIERAVSAIRGLELRLKKRLELLDGYSRVANMIEIEVEIDAELPAAEVQGIEDQIDRLEEVAEMQADWKLQADAQDEVEHLLRAN